MIVWAGLLAEGEVGRGRGKDSWAGLSSQQVCVCVGRVWWEGMCGRTQSGVKTALQS